MDIVDKHQDSIRSIKKGFPNEILYCSKCQKENRYPLYRWWELRKIRSYQLIYVRTFTELRKKLFGRFCIKCRIRDFLLRTQFLAFRGKARMRKILCRKEIERESYGKEL